MRTVCLVLFTALGSGLQSQAALQIENAALRHQLAVLQRQARGRPRLRPVDRLFWTWLCHLWPGRRRALVIVKPDTVLRWHRRGFRCYWRWKSRPRGPGRPRIPRAVQVLIRQMCHANPTWGAPRIHGELLKLGIAIAEATVGHYNGASSAPAVPDLAYVSDESHRPTRLGRLLRGPDAHVSREASSSPS